MRSNAYNRRLALAGMKNDSCIDTKADDERGAPVLGLCGSLAVFARIGLVPAHIIRRGPKVDEESEGKEEGRRGGRGEGRGGKERLRGSKQEGWMHADRMGEKEEMDTSDIRPQWRVTGTGPIAAILVQI